MEILLPSVGVSTGVLRFWIWLRRPIYGQFRIPIPIPDPGFSRSGSTLDLDPPQGVDPVSVQITHQNHSIQGHLVLYNIFCVWTDRQCGKYFCVYAKGNKRNNSLPIQDCTLWSINSEQVGASKQVIHDIFDVDTGGIKCPETMQSLKLILKKLKLCTLRRTKGQYHNLR